jgi:hypothetical protein
MGQTLIDDDGDVVVRSERATQWWICKGRFQRCADGPPRIGEPGRSVNHGDALAGGGFQVQLPPAAGDGDAHTALL